MAIDERGRWCIDRDEPFNAALGGIDPGIIHDSMDPINDTRMLVMTWIAVAALAAIAVLGGSIVFGGFAVLTGAFALRWTVRRPRRS